MELTNTVASPRSRPQNTIQNRLRIKLRCKHQSTPQSKANGPAKWLASRKLNSTPRAKMTKWSSSNSCKTKHQPSTTSPSLNWMKRSSCTSVVYEKRRICESMRYICQETIFRPTIQRKRLRQYEPSSPLLSWRAFTPSILMPRSIWWKSTRPTPICNKTSRNWTQM